MTKFSNRRFAIIFAMVIAIALFTTAKLGMINKELQLGEISFLGFVLKNGEYITEENYNFHEINSLLNIKKQTDYLVEYKINKGPGPNIKISTDLFSEKYDNIAQEFTINTKDGARELSVSKVINSGDSPNQAYLRIFYQGTGELKISSIRIKKIPKFVKYLDQIALSLFILLFYYLIRINYKLIIEMTDEIIKKYKTKTVHIFRDFNINFLIMTYFLLVMLRFLLYSITPYWGGDEYLYKMIGNAIWMDIHLSGEMIGIPPNAPNYMYPWIISVSNNFPGASYEVVRLINSLVINLCIFPAYLIARKYVDSKYAIAAGISSALIPFINIGAYAVTEVLFYPLFLYFLKIYICEDYTKKITWIKSAIVISLLMQVKIMAFIIYPAIVMSELLVSIKNKSINFNLIYKFISIGLIIYITNLLMNWILGVGDVGGVGMYGGVLSTISESIQLVLNNKQGFLNLIAGHISIIYIPYALIVIYALFNYYEEKNLNELTKLQSVIASFTFIMIGFTVAFTISVSPFDLGGFGRWHSRYYFYLYPIFIIYIFIALKNNIIVKNKIQFIIVFISISLINYYFINIFNALGNEWFGSTVDNIDIQWYRLYKNIFILFTISYVLIAFLYLKNSKIASIFYLITLFVFIIISNKANWSLSGVGNGDGESKCSQSLKGFLKKNDDRYVVIASDRGKLVEIAFWQNIIPIQSIITIDPDPKLDYKIMLKNNIKYIIVNGEIKLNELDLVYIHDKCKIYKINN